MPSSWSETSLESRVSVPTTMSAAKQIILLEKKTLKIRQNRGKLIPRSYLAFVVFVITESGSSFGGLGPWALYHTVIVRVVPIEGII